MSVGKVINRSVLNNIIARARCMSWGSNFLNNSREQPSNCERTIFRKTLYSIFSSSHCQSRFKYNKSQKNAEIGISTSNPEEFLEPTDGKDTKVTTTKISSLRLDSIIKTGLGIARNKVETAFYESRIRVNGEKVVKKSVTLHVGDEVDVIKGFSPINVEHLIVSRISILAATANEEDISVTMRKFKSLTIENYDGQNIYKSANN